MNKWNIPEWLEREVLARDTACVYCGCEFIESNSERRLMPSWEHIVNDAKIVTRENIARCCVGCNASKGAKPLLEWLKSSYCQKKGISEATVAPVVQPAIWAARPYNPS
tara:strand:+ start:5164 stop:5490 length:327 start_codon:yes stop_codon:yes gene_type:complete